MGLNMEASKMQAMQVDSPDKIRNVAVAGHNDTGKTTLVSALLTPGVSQPG
jgi:translation elongation factor EF-G